MRYKNKSEELFGKRFGKLIAIEPIASEPEKYLWRCKCDCGNECVVYKYDLLKGKTRSCGCLRSPDLIGQQFGKLTVLERSDKIAPRGDRVNKLWKCRCECGAIVYRASDVLKSKGEHSCRQCANKKAVNAMQDKAGFVDGTQLYKIQNTRPTAANTSGVPGVSLDKKTNKWRVRLWFKGKKYEFGSYKNFDEAVRVRKKAEKEIFGTFLETLQNKKTETEEQK